MGANLSQDQFSESSLEQTNTATRKNGDENISKSSPEQTSTAANQNGDTNISKSRLEQTNTTTRQNGDANTKANETTKAAITTTTTTREVKLPHNYEAIVKHADSPLDKSSINKLYEQLYVGVFLNQKRKKYWVDEKTNSNCFMVFARDLSITWAEDKRYWQWSSLKETASDECVDVAELRNVCWLEVHGKFDAENLTPGVKYEVGFVVMLKDPAYGWEVPVNVRLKFPDGNIEEHKVNLMEKQRGKWITISVGEISMYTYGGGEIEFSLYDYEGGKWKRGLVIKGVVIQPKN